MIYSKIINAPEYNVKEILRYAGAGADAEGTEGLIKECIAEAERVLTYKVCWCELETRVSDDCVDLGLLEIKSKGLAKNLDGCDSVVLFAATVGIGIDRLIARYGGMSPAKALIFQAIGAERIEALCDAFCDELKETAKRRGKNLRPRFSPGYGDLALDVQKEFFRILDCHRKIGLALNESLLMSPSKSVTAIAGISDCRENTAHGCAICGKKDCEYRKGIQKK